MNKSQRGRNNRRKGNDQENKLANAIPFAVKVSVPGKTRDDLRIRPTADIELSVESKNVGKPWSGQRTVEYAEERAPDGMPVVGITHVNRNGDPMREIVSMRLGTLVALLEAAHEYDRRRNLGLTEHKDEDQNYAGAAGCLLWHDQDSDTIVIVPDFGASKVQITTTASKGVEVWAK